MARADTDGEKIFLTTGYLDQTRAKEVPGAKWDKSRRAWRYPLSWATCVQLRGVFGSDLEIGPGLATWATEERSRRIDPAMIAREDPASE